MRDFNYSKIKEQKWDSEVLSLIAAIYKYVNPNNSPVAAE